MNREIKFRAWDKKNNHLWDWDYISNHLENLVYWLETKFKGDNRFEVMQYTGLKDKKGIEIYEGDIVRILLPEREGLIPVWLGDDIGDEATTIFTEKEIIGEIRINPQSGTRLLVRKIISKKPKHDKDKEFKELDIGKYFKIRKEDEVIGNIYSNPELIEKK